MLKKPRTYQLETKHILGTGNVHLLPVIEPNNEYAPSASQIPLTMMKIVVVWRVRVHELNAEKPMVRLGFKLLSPRQNK